MRALIQPIYIARRLILGWLRLRTRGVKVMLFNNAGELLLIRNSYGNRKLFVLPGGGVSRRETSEAAALREVKEELGVDASDLQLVGVYRSGAEGKRDIIHLFRAQVSGTILTDPAEIEQATFFPLDALPDSVSPATRRRIKELESAQTANGQW